MGEAATLATLLRHYRERALLTQEQLAERAGLSVRTVRGLELGQVRRPRMGSIRDLAVALRLSDDERETLVRAVRNEEVEPPRGAPAQPSQLPMDVADFTGRDQQVAALLAHFERPAGAVALAAVAGRGGVGKTALAVHVAHLLRERFPDGQLFAGLRGTTAPVAPGEVLAAFLRALGVHGGALPADTDERAAHYRSLLADRLVLVVLDDAADAAQVTPLLPGSPGCGVLITSRARLAGLPGARLVELDVLEPRQAVALLARVAGGPRVAAEPEAAARLAECCGRLPLALRIAGARLAARPQWRLDHLAERLGDEHRRLDELAHGALAVRASLALSYAALEPRAQALFRRLGLLAAPDLPAWAGAAVLDGDADEAAALCERLVDVQLLDPAGQATRRPRYRFHDLVRLFARERAEAEDPPEVRRAALARALGGWLGLAREAQRAHDGGDFGLVHGNAARWLPDAATRRALLVEPIAWFEEERSGIDAAIRQGADEGLDELVWDLAFTAEVLYSVRAYLDDWRVSHEHAVRACERAGNRRGQAAMACHLGRLLVASGRTPEAADAQRRAQALFTEVGDRHGYALALLDMGGAQRTMGQDEDALRSTEVATAILREVGDRMKEAEALRRLGQIHLQVADHDRAAGYLDEAMRVISAIDAPGSRITHHHILLRIGDLHQAKGELDQAARAYEQGMDLTRHTGDRRADARMRMGLAQTRLEQGDPAAARALLSEAVATGEATGDLFVIGTAHERLGLLDLREDDPAGAAAHLSRAAATWRASGQPADAARAETALARAEALAAS